MIDDLQSNFQAGVSSVYDAIVAKGVTPASTSLSDIITGIGNINTGTTVTKVGTIPYSSGTSSLNISSIYSNYRNITVSNIFVVVQSGSTTVMFSTYGHPSSGSTSGGYQIKVTYNSSTGIISFSQPSNNTWLVGVATGPYDVYIIEGI